jgi:predicted RNA-binding protein with RPS1 domain
MDTLEERYSIGAAVEGEITKMTDFGAFVRLPDGIEGLVHISELVNEQGESMQGQLQVGQRVKLRVLKVSREEQKLGLSMRLDGSRDTNKRTGPRSEGRDNRGGDNRGGDNRGGDNRGGDKRRPGNDRRQGEASTSAFGDKLKSQLQLELERHNYRNKSSQESE